MAQASRLRLPDPVRLGSACHGRPSSERSKQVRAAIERCHSCPNVAACEAWATSLIDPAPTKILAGMTLRQRDQQRRRIRSLDWSDALIDIKGFVR